MITLRVETGEEARAALAALEDGPLAAFQVWVLLGDDYAGGTPGTDTGPVPVPRPGRHRQAPRLACAS